MKKLDYFRTSPDSTESTVKEHPRKVKESNTSIILERF